MAILFTNNALTTLAANISNSDTVVTVAASTGGNFPSVTGGGGDYFVITMEDASGNREFIKVETRSTDTFGDGSYPCTRGYWSSTPRAWVAGDSVDLRWSADAIQEYLQNLSGRYLGAFASAPTVDEFGTAVQAGDTYYDTVAGKLYYYNGSTWSEAISFAGLASTSTDNAIVRFNGTAGGTQNSGVTIDDSNNITSSANITTSTANFTTAEVGTAIFSTAEVGHASDTTLYRVASGRLGVEGVALVRTSSGSSTDNAVVRFDSTTGELIQNTGVTINDNNQVAIPNTNFSPSSNANAAILINGTGQFGGGIVLIDTAYAGIWTTTNGATLVFGVNGSSGGIVGQNTMNGNGIQIAGQVTFPSTQNPSSDAYTLDDYRELNWTPTLGGTSSLTITYARETKIGRTVFVSCKFSVASIGTGSTIFFTGLNYTPAIDTPGSCRISNAATSVLDTAVLISTDGHITVFSKTAAATSYGVSNIFTTGTQIEFDGRYEV